MRGEGGGEEAARRWGTAGSPEPPWSQVTRASAVRQLALLSVFTASNIEVCSLAPRLCSTASAGFFLVSLFPSSSSHYILRPRRRLIFQGTVVINRCFPAGHLLPILEPRREPVTRKSRGYFVLLNYLEFLDAHKVVRCISLKLFD